VNFNGVMGVLADYYFLDTHQTSESWSIHNCVHDWTLAVLNKEIDTENYWYVFDCVDAPSSGVATDSFRHIYYSRLATYTTRLVQQRFLRSDIISSSSHGRLDQVSRISKLLRDQMQLVAAEQISL
jgi:hypothetical protein